MPITHTHICMIKFAVCTQRNKILGNFSEFGAGSCTSELQLKVNCRPKVKSRKKILGWLSHHTMQ